MYSKDTYNRRCIIQKLDFENCIITNIKTTTRGRKKLRARITREAVEQFGNNVDEEKPLNFPVSTEQAQEPTSPVLIKKQGNRESPVFFKRKKNNPEKDVEDLSGGSSIEQMSSSPSSPVFKSFKKQKKGNVSINPSQEFHNVLGRTTSLDVFDSQGNTSSGLPSSLKIEDFTQESKESVKISSVESIDIKNDYHCVYSIDADSAVSCQSPAQLPERFNIQEKVESPKSYRKNYKKNSLLGRLHKLQQKQASEKLLWQHQNRKKSSASLNVSINTIWKDDFNYFLKCQPTVPDSELTFLIVDSRWAPNIKMVKEGSVLQLHPPWQKLSLEESSITVLLNVICLDVLDETRNPAVEKRTAQSLPPELFETNEKLFLDSLFSSCTHGFLF